MTQPEGQTARDIFPEDEGVPEVSQDDSPTIARSEDPEFAPVPRDDAGASVDFGTTAFEQSEGESLTGRLERELPDVDPDADLGGGLGGVVGGVRSSEDPQRAMAQLEQDTSTTFDSDSGTGRTADDVEATADVPVGGESAEEAAVHPID
jgi:hypothetical protein